MILHALETVVHALQRTSFFAMTPPTFVIVVLPLAGIALGALGLVGGLWFTDRNRRRRHETIRLALEKGVPIPDTLLNEDEHGRRVAPQNPGGKSARNDLRSGLITFSVGVGIFLFFLGVGAGGAEWLAAIPAMIGLALMINGVIERFTPPPPSA